MKAKTQILFFCAASFLLSSCTRSLLSGDKKETRDTVYTINGKLRGIESGTVNLSYFFDGKGINDSARVTQGVFQFNGKVTFPQRAYLTLKTADQFQEAVFFLDNGTTTVYGSADSLEDAAISGTAAQEEFRNYTKEMKPFEDQMAAFDEAYESIVSPSEKTSDSLLKVYDQIISRKLAAIGEYVQTHPESFVAATEVLNNFYFDPRVSQLDSVYGFMAPVVKSSPFGEKILKMLETARKTDVGQVAPDFTLNDVNGKPQALSSLKGKVLLVDFWASWCGPCREENPNLVASFKKYHRKGFEVLGVSLDTKKEKWLAAIKDDELTWNHVSDLNGWKSSAADLYGIRAIPMSYLLDKDGKIVAKNLRGNSLSQKLDELLK